MKTLLRMKKLFIYGIALAGITSLASCERDILEQYPTASISPNTFFKTENDLIAYTNSFYSELPGGSDIYGEQADNIVKSSVPREIAGTRLVPTTDSKWGWAALRNINFFLNSENVRNFPNTEIRDKYIGVAKFFRAMFYYEKVRYFGDVPWYSVVIETNDEENLYKGRDPRTLIMDSIMADLDFAIAHLGTAKDIERINKWTALALKANVGLYEGTWRKYHTEFSLPDSEKFLRAAVSASEEIMNSGLFKLYTATSGPTGNPYQDLFATITLDPVADEVILGRRYSNEYGIRHGLQFYITARTQGKPGLEKKLVNSYLMADGSRFTDIPGYETMQYQDEIKNRDPRLSQTIKFPGYRRIGTNALSSVDFESTMTGYQPIKHMSLPEMDGNNQSYQDLIIFRFGEVLLNYAEAKAELGELTQADLDISINLLRARAGMPDLNMDWANANPDPYQANMYRNVSGANAGVILEIRRERRIELVMENNFRWEDLMRWKEGHLLTWPFQGAYFPGPGKYDLDGNGVYEIEIYSGDKPPATGPYQLPASDLSEGLSGNILTNRNIAKSFDENRDYLWPLPIEDLTLNTNLTQNPNWR